MRNKCSWNSQGKGLAHRIDNIGPVHPSAVGEVVSQADAMILLSALESFSNNLVESWALKRPLSSSPMHFGLAIAVVKVLCTWTQPIRWSRPIAIRNLFFDKRQQSKIIENGGRQR